MSKALDSIPTTTKKKEEREGDKKKKKGKEWRERRNLRNPIFAALLRRLPYSMQVMTVRP